MSITNAHKPGYKHTPLGWIPDDWRVAKFSEVCSAILDGTHFSPKSQSGPYKYITSKNIRNGGMDLTNVQYISKDEHTEIYKRCPVKYGDILLTKDGAGTGACCLNTLTEPFSLLSSVALLRSADTFDNGYLYHFIRSPKGQSIINEAISGQAITRITLEKIREFKVVAPAQVEQRKIASILSIWDEAIQKTQQLIEQVKQRNKGLSQQLLSGKKRLKGFSGKWKNIRIGDIIRESRIQSVHNDVTKRITVKLNLRGIENRDVKGSELDGATAYFTRKAGQFIYGKQNLHKGAFGIIPPHLDGFDSSQDIPAFDFIGTTNPKYFLYYMSQEGWYEALENISTGTGSKRIHPDKLCRLSFDIPSLEEQNAIVALLEIASSELKLYEQQLASLQQQKKGLMQKLLSGEVRVKIVNK